MLFADIVGWTSLAQEVEAEEVMLLLHGEGGSAGSPFGGGQLQRGRLSRTLWPLRWRWHWVEGCYARFVGALR